MRYFAMLDDQTVVEIKGARDIQEAFDNEPACCHWVFSEEGLQEFIQNAKDALMGGS